MLHPHDPKARYATPECEYNLGIEGDYLVVLGKGIKGRVANGKLQVYRHSPKDIIALCSPFDTTPAPVKEEAELESLLRALGCSEVEVHFSTVIVEFYSKELSFVLRANPTEESFILDERKKGWLVENDMTEVEFRRILWRLWELGPLFYASYYYSSDKGLYLP